MSGKNSLSLFDQLAIEILFEIFDYLSYNDLIYIFFYLNQRFNSIVLEYHRFLNHFTTPTNHFSFWQTILSTIHSRIEYLTITTTDFPLSLDSFSNLKSLIISSSLPIYHDELTMLLKSKQLKKLHSFQIKSAVINRSDTHEIPFFHKIFQEENSLQVFESLSELYFFDRIHNGKIHLNLQSLSLKVFDIKNLLPLLSYTPNLKYLNLIVSTFGVTIQSNPNIDFSQIKLKKLSIVIQSGGIHPKSFLFLSWFIQQFLSSLTYLSLNLNQITTYEFTFNGSILQQQLLESMIQLKSFHFYIQLDQKPRNVEYFLSTFQTQFWLDHQWTFGTHGRYLYTLPFHFEQLKDFLDFNQIKSSNTKIFKSSRTWSRVKSIEFSQSFQFHSNVIEQLKLQMPNLTSTNFNCQLMNNFCTNVTDRTLDMITTVHWQAAHSQMIQTCLINVFPNIRHLTLSHDLQLGRMLSFLGKRTTKDDICPSKIQYVEMKIMLRDEVNDADQHAIRLVGELLEILPNLPSFIFHFHHLERFPSIIPYTNLNQMIQLLNMETILEKYQIKHMYNYLQFIRQNNI